MTPPEQKGQGKAEAPEAAPAVLSCSVATTQAVAAATGTMPEDRTAAVASPGATSSPETLSPGTLPGDKASADPRSAADRDTARADPCPAASAPHKPAILTLRHRADFLRAASARRQGAGSFLLQGRDRADGTATVRVGFTASKKVGNAVARNRAKRRLREIARATLPRLGRSGWDYVLVARPGSTIARVYADLLADLEAALRSLHRERPPRGEAAAETPPAGGRE